MSETDAADDQYDDVQDRIEARMQEIGPAVDRGDAQAEAEYVALSKRSMALHDEHLRLKRGETAIPTPAPAPITPTPIERSDADLQAALQDNAVRIEEAKEARDSLKKKDGASARFQRADRAWRDALNERDGILAEQKARVVGQVRDGLTAQLVRKRAVQSITDERLAAVNDLRKMQRQSRRPYEIERIKLDIQRAEAWARTAPTPEEVEARLPAAQVEFDKTAATRGQDPKYVPKMPVLDLERSGVPPGETPVSPGPQPTGPERMPGNDPRFVY